MIKKTIRIQEMNIAYAEHGPGEPLLFLHGFGTSSFAWRAIVRMLPGYRCIALDMKGFGNSDKPNDHRYSMQDQAQIVSDFITALDLDNLVLVGHSLGGGVALTTVSSASASVKNRIKALILLNPVAFPQRAHAFIKLLQAPVLGKIGLTLIPAKFLVRALLRNVYFNDEKIADETVCAYARNINLPGAHQALISTARQLILKDSEEMVLKYSNITVPTLIIWGDHDMAIPMANGKKLSSVIPHSKFEVIANCGHVPQEEAPRETGEKISSFLETLPSRRH